MTIEDHLSVTRQRKKLVGYAQLRWIASEHRHNCAPEPEGTK
jgi:hypothetical protein